MSIETYQFNLPITPGAIPPVLHLSQYDSGRTFTAILRDDANVPFELDSGATAVIKGRNAAGIAWQQDCTVSGANVTFTPSGAATDQFGVMPVTIEITESEEVISPLCVVFHIQKAGYTNEEAVLSPDFETAIQAAVAQAISEGGLGFSDEFKEALLACFNGVAWATAGGQALVDDLEAALYPDAHLVSITAAYDQDRPIYDTDSLETVIATINLDLTVVANYSDGTSETLSSSDYTITGTVEPGASVPFTVTYEGKTDTISVLVVERYSFSMSGGQIIKIDGTTDGVIGSEFYITANTKRRVFALLNGRVPLKESVGGNLVESDYYPIPVPIDATSVTVSITPNTQFFNISYLEQDVENATNRKYAETGWQQGSYTYTIPTGTVGTNRVLGFNAKYNSSGGTYAAEPTEFVVQFNTT